ncbi:MAG: Aspartate aminotransferase [Candidatus Roizmanbacteria bacterium GW2011_GWA2_35_8]|uniref:Aminotransferase n=1 Tax=Candidatus Roizmanbacteria bacterium GW2011_GWA2_35_8 TaxID=1618479 RepID=A0A0G0D1K2_9BACT|nr:MAG: Aspartate aminotransferase [Candidatus Roizmanbacteria bacterium GW2011_GWA2_35_8]
MKVPASPMRKFVPYATAAKKNGVKILHLNIGDPDIKTPEVMIKALNNWSQNPIRYSQSQGEPVFLEALKFYYHKIGYEFIEKKNIQVTTGGSEAISMTFFAVAEPGDEVIVFEPFYANYNSYAAVNSIKLVPIKTEEKTGFHLPTKSEIEKKISNKTKAIMICNPSNPTGTVYLKQEMDMLAELCEKHNLFFISDEVYREFVYDGMKHISVLDYMKKMPEKIILLDSLSKRYSLCGARLGMLITLNKEINAGVLRIGQGRLSSGLIDQFMASKLTEVKDDYFQQVHKEYQKRRDVLYEGLKKIPGVYLEKPKGAFYTIVKLPVKNSEDFCKWLLTDFRIDDTTVMMAPAAGFYGTPGLGKDEVRIAYILNSDDLRKAIEILERALIEYRD